MIKLKEEYTEYDDFSDIWAYNDDVKNMSADVADKLLQKIADIGTELNEYFGKHHIWSSFYAYTIESYGGAFQIRVDGDWKHDHLYCKHLAKQFFKDKGIRYQDAGESMIKDTGTDSYSSLHNFVIALVDLGYKR